MSKVCTKCKKKLPNSQFYKDKRKSDGLYCCCKECHNTHISNTMNSKNEIIVLRACTYCNKLMLSKWKEYCNNCKQLAYNETREPNIERI